MPAVWTHYKILVLNKTWVFRNLQKDSKQDKDKTKLKKLERKENTPNTPHPIRNLKMMCLSYTKPKFRLRLNFRVGAYEKDKQYTTKHKKKCRSVMMKTEPFGF